MEKPCDRSIIYCMPVEILSLIFLIVRDAMTDFQLDSNAQTKARFHQPPQSPPLLVGAVCRRWRDSTLETPKLWTEIFINLAKCAKGQFNMVEKWACRSGALPLDITIFDVVRKPHLELQRPPDFWYHFKDVIWVIRSLANRWHDLALYVPDCFSYHLLNNFQGTPPINSLFLQIIPFSDEKWDQKPFLRHPLIPRRFIYRTFLQSPSIPIEWDRLIYLETTHVDHAQILHIIYHAQNLKHCRALGEVRNDTIIPTNNITNHSLIYLKTNQDILRHLTLPSLSHLECTVSKALNWDLVTHINSIVGFVHRSRAPLDEFILRCTILLWLEFPGFDGLPEITSLFLDIIGYAPPDPSRIDDFFLALTRPSHPILPRLKTINVVLPYLSPSSWSLIAVLFWKNTGSISAPIDPTSNTSFPLSNRQLSQVHIRFNEDFEVLMDKDTFLRLLEAKKSGVDLIIMDKEKDLFEHLAKLHEVLL